MAFSSIASLAGSAISTITEWAGSAVVGEFISTGFSYLRDRGLPADSEAELKRLQAALPQIKAVMGIAEALKVKDPNTSEWVEQFRQAVEASEDVLDELEYKKLEDMVKNRDEAGGSTSSSKKRKVSALNDDTLERLKKALTMLDRAAAETERLVRHAKRLGIHGLSESQQETGKALRPETTSFLTEMKVFGRKVEKEKIIGWLKRPTDARLSSFGIVGVGGLGKTTLAQFAYQKMHGSNHFDKTIWVCVSTNFSVEDITRKMLGELGESSCTGKPLNALQETLKEKIHLKKFLIVLDDVWDDKKMSDWEKLVAPLRFVQHGSKILFTTRMKSVAELLESVISTTEHESLALQGLREQELRLLFQNYAFRRFNLDNHRDLQAIGDQILKMLRGSPLAAKVIGSLLNSHIDHQYWRRILNHGSLFNLEQAKDVVEVLKLSYYHLPANLQVCFRFCSIYPQDHSFDKDELIQMWICSGFIPQQLCQEERPEDIGEDYFNHLLRKSFFEYSESYRGKKWYTMHDLMHELAQNVSYGECCRIEPNDKGSTIPSTVRHVSAHGSEIDRVSNLENLRSLVIYHCSNMSSLKNLIKKPLRLLKIDVDCTFELPEEIRCLVHLRYLSIAQNFMSQPVQYSVPGSIYKLYHLQVLELSTYTSNPRIETTGITNLLRLRYMKLPNNTIETIRAIHKLKSLQELTFFIGKEIGYHINELGTLSNLRNLSIEKIENIGDDTEAKSANLLGKNNLMSLSLKWTSNSNPIHPEKIIDNLQPPPSLMELTINNYKGQRSPNWMVDSPPLNLSSLKLLNCPLWKNQLFSGKMPYLKILDIRRCLNLDKLPDMPLSLIEFRISNVGLTSLPALYQNSSNNTPAPLSLKSSLRVVEIKSCPNLISLDGFLEQGNLDLQTIKELTIKDCERLVHLPTHGSNQENNFNVLNVDIMNCPNLMKLPTFLSLSHARFCIDNVGLSALPEYYRSSDSSGDPSTSSLRIVSIKNCQNIKSLNGFLQQDHIDFQSIKQIEVINCKNLVHLPLGAFGKFVSLQRLIISDCPMLMAIDKQSTLLPMALEYLEIRNCGKVDEPLLESASSHPTLSDLIFINYGDISQHKFCINNVGLSALPEYYRSFDSSGGPSTSSLRTVSIKNCQNIKSLNGFLQQDHIDFQSIWQIEVINCKNLVHLPMGAFGKFVSLQGLRISDCPMLTAIDNQSTLLPMALKCLIIGNCGKVDEPLLESASSLPMLTDLRIINCANISHIPSSENAFGSLNMLSICGCQKILEHSSREQAHGANQVSSLASLKIKNLSIDKLSLLLIEPLRSLRFVSYLTVYDCSGMEAFPEHWLLQNNSTLTKLTLRDGRTLKSLPATMARLTVLEELQISYVHLLEELPELPASLRSLYFWGARSLKSLPATMARLTVLENLTIGEADLLEELPELPASLRSLYFWGARSLKSLPATMAMLTVLENLTIEEADLLEELPELPTSLKERNIKGRGGRCL